MNRCDIPGDDFHVDLHNDKTHIGDGSIDIGSVSMFLFKLGESLTESKFVILLFGEGVIEH